MAAEGGWRQWADGGSGRMAAVGGWRQSADGGSGRMAAEGGCGAGRRARANARTGGLGQAAGPVGGPLRRRQEPALPPPRAPALQEGVGVASAGGGMKERAANRAQDKGTVIRRPRDMGFGRPRATPAQVP